jgi:electron-transferring-flavoprotein dehydrogenase
VLAAETVFECLLNDDFSAPRLANYETKVAGSWAAAELRSMRNFHQAFDGGLYLGMLRSGFQMYAGGFDPFGGDRLRGHYGHEKMEKLAERHPGGKPAPLKPDGKLTFDKLADVYLSGTTHDEDQPAHLKVADTHLCATRCREEFGNPCQHFCPANVYEMVPDPSQPGALQLRINASNCVHCKTCDIADPYQIITWVTPEGGGGPDYKRL